MQFLSPTLEIRTPIFIPSINHIIRGPLDGEKLRGKVFFFVDKLRLTTAFKMVWRHTEHNENVILVKYKGIQDFYSYRHEASSRTLALEVDDGILGWSLTVLEPEWTSTGPFEDVHVLDGVQEIVP